MTMKPLRPIAHDDPRGQPWLSRAAVEARVEQQPATVLEALRMHGVGRKTTERLLARFTQNLTRHKLTVSLLKPFEAADERGFTPWAQVIPKAVGDRLTLRLAADEDLEDASIASMIDCDRRDPEGDYFFKVSEETKERWLERKREQEKKKV